MSIDDILKLFAAAGVLLTIFVSLYTAVKSASKDGFEQLKTVVDKLQIRVNELSVENEGLRKLRDDYEKDKFRKEEELRDLRERVESLESENQRKDEQIKELKAENLRLKNKTKGFGMK